MSSATSEKKCTAFNRKCRSFFVCLESSLFCVALKSRPHFLHAFQIELTNSPNVSFDIRFLGNLRSAVVFCSICLCIYLVSGIIVGGLGGCCGTIRPRRVGTRCGSDMSPADLNDIMPVPLLTSSPFGCDTKQTRPPCFGKEKQERGKMQFNIKFKHGLRNK